MKLFRKINLNLSRGAVARASGKHWSPIVTVPRPFSMTVRAEKAGPPKHTRASLEVEKARIEREEAERQLIAAKKTFKGKLTAVCLEFS